jgi:riboflavin synthase
VFTGIVEEIGIIRETHPGTLVVSASIVMSDLRVGDSISIDGICLTVTKRTETTFTVNVQPETSRRTTSDGLTTGQRVNLERAVQPTGRLGGHIVQGHVDGTGRLSELRPDGDGLIVRIETPRPLLRYIVTKGFISVNGVSLTVVDVGDSWFTVALVLYTRQNVSLLDGGVGSEVNLEVDILAKYVERLLLGDHRGDSTIGPGGLTIDKLREAGFAR